MAEDSNDQMKVVIDLAKLGLGGFIVYKVGQRFGIFSTKEEDDLAEASNQTAASSTQTYANNPFVAFNPNYAAAIVKAYNKKNAPKVFDGTWNLAGKTQADYLKMADQLRRALGAFDDNEDIVYDVFRQIQTQWQLSLLSGVFSTFFEKDLYNYLAKPNGFMSPAEMAPILQIIKNYPQYRPKS